MYEVLRYVLPSGRIPINEWLNGIRDKVLRNRILLRIKQVEAGNLGDSTAVGQGVIELRIHHGAGYRIYCGRHGSTVVILLVGGDKSTQAADIKKAQRFWDDWKRR